MDLTFNHYIKTSNDCDRLSIRREERRKKKSKTSGNFLGYELFHDIPETCSNSG